MSILVELYTAYRRCGLNPICAAAVALRTTAKQLSKQKTFPRQ
jgi:hypothetical protein